MSVKISNICLRNYRGFKFFDMHLDSRLTVIVGENGAGKSSLIDAFRLLIWSYIRYFSPEAKYVRRPKLVKSDVYGKSSKHCYVYGSMEGNSIDGWGDEDFPNWIGGFGCVFKGGRTSWVDMELGGDALLKKFDLDLHELGKLIDPDVRLGNLDVVNLPVICFFDVNRLWVRRRGSRKLPVGSSRLSGYDGALNNNSRLFDVNYFIEIMLEKKDVNSSVYDYMSVVSGAVLHVTGWHSVWGKDLALYYHRGGVYLSFSQLGAGLQSLVLMVSELAVRCLLLNPHYGKNALDKIDGIVLVDEIDLHLHPGLQQTVLIRMQECFPCVQFIVTTHSPQVLTSVDRECIRVIESFSSPDSGERETGLREVEYQTKGVASSELLSQIMGVRPVPDVKEATWLDEYQALVQQGLWLSKKGVELRNKLDNHFGEGHPVILECERMIRLQDFKIKISKKREGKS
ncbi:AAA family ATPase [Pigmentiphaga aceris]|uniref:AAA family ATPase n=1 Tax=Pigmentiphaga aceris TaxID=1940612 RepID=UPI00248294FE|nr:AAA family ATPase [Pigmentiphaga aceris]